MTDIAIILPTKGRPENFKRFIESYNTNTSGNSTVIPVFDDFEVVSYEWNNYYIATPQSYGLVRKLNHAANILRLKGYKYLIFMADDLVIHTKDFDKMIAEVFKEEPKTNLIYWEDMLNGKMIANHWAIRTDVVSRVGFMALPVCKHCFIDNFWTKVGNETGTIKYMPNIVIEHRHYVGRTAPLDDTYRLSNNSDVMSHDSEAYNKYMAEELPKFLIKYNG